MKSRIGAAAAAAPLDEDLLQLFIVEKAAYEVCYELANRPDWVEVPLRGLLDTLEGAAAHEGRAAG